MNKMKSKVMYHDCLYKIMPVHGSKAFSLNKWRLPKSLEYPQMTLNICNKFNGDPYNSYQDVSV